MPVDGRETVEVPHREGEERPESAESGSESPHREEDFFSPEHPSLQGFGEEDIDIKTSPTSRGDRRRSTRNRKRKLTVPVPFPRKSIRRSVRSAMTPTRHSPTGSGRSNPGASKQAAKPTAVESTILKELRDIKGQMGKMEDSLVVRMTTLEGQMEAGLADTKKAVGSLEGRVRESEAGIETKIDTALDKRMAVVETGLTKMLEDKVAMLPGVVAGAGPSGPAGSVAVVLSLIHI